jgi:hypothetical protein
MDGIISRHARNRRDEAVNLGRGDYLISTALAVDGAIVYARAGAEIAG